MVLTGVSTEEEVERDSIKPDYVFADLPALMAGW